MPEFDSLIPIPVPRSYVGTVLDARLRYGTNAARIAAGVVDDGCLWFETDTHNYYQYQLGFWVLVAGSALGSGAPVMIAASNATAIEKLFAIACGGVVCDGVNDQTEINAALLANTHVLLSSGTFTIAANIIPLAGSWLSGSGIFETILNFTVSDKYVSIHDISNVRVSDFSITGYGTIQPYAQNSNIANILIENIFFNATSPTLNPACLYTKNHGHTIANMVFRNIFGAGIKTTAIAFYDDVGTAIYQSCNIFKNYWTYGGSVADKYSDFDCGSSYYNGTFRDCIIEDTEFIDFWEAGAYIENGTTCINVIWSKIITRNIGRAKVAPTFGAGFCLNDGHITISNCMDYGSLLGLYTVGTGIANQLYTNFRSYAAGKYGIYGAASVAGDRIRFIGGGIYNSGDCGLYWLVPNLNMEHFDIIDPTGSGGILNFVNSHNAKLKDLYIKGTGLGLYSTDCTDLTFTDNRILVTGIPFSFTSGVISPYIANNDWRGSGDNPVFNCTTPKAIKDNIDKDGNIYASSGQLVTISKTINHADITDDGGAVGHAHFTNTIPANSVIKAVSLVFGEAFDTTGMTTLTMQIGIPAGDLDAYNLTVSGEDMHGAKPDVSWGEVNCTASRVLAAVIPILTFTHNADITDLISGAGCQGSCTVTITYMKA
jgi:hypothetical protein